MQGQVANQPPEIPNLLSDAEKPVVETFNAGSTADIVLVCEHASNSIPLYFNGLGLSDEEKNSHIAWDLGAKGVALALSAAFDAPLVSSRISRLVYDCNRPPTSPTAIPSRSENSRIPGNQSVSNGEQQARFEQIYQPFYQCLKSTISPLIDIGRRPVLVTIHSFTPVFFGKQRPTQIGILHSQDERMANAMLAIAPETTSMRVERNLPYGPKDGVAHTLDVHGGTNALPNVMIEIRNDLLSTPEAISNVASILKSMIEKSLPRLDKETEEGARNA